MIFELIASHTVSLHFSIWWKSVRAVSGSPQVREVFVRYISGKETLWIWLIMGESQSHECDEISQQQHEMCLHQQWDTTIALIWLWESKQKALTNISPMNVQIKTFPKRFRLTPSQVGPCGPLLPRSNSVGQHRCRLLWGYSGNTYDHGLCLHNLPKTVYSVYFVILLKKTLYTQNKTSYGGHYTTSTSASERARSLFSFAK